MSNPQSRLSVVATAESEPHRELTPLQMIALLRMNRSTLCRGVASLMQNDVQDKPAWSDYRALAALRLCVKDKEGPFHTITMLGQLRAKDIARAEARKRGLRILIEGGSVGAYQNFSCTCGKWRTAYRRGLFTAGNASTGFAAHVAAASGESQAESA